MAYEFLKKLFGTTEDGQPEALTFEQVQKKLEEGELNIVDLSAGGYVSKDKLDAKITELNGVKKQLDEANETIGSYKEKDMDLEKIQKSADEWKEKYDSDTKELQEQLKNQEYSHAVDMYMNGYKFSSKPAREGVRAEFDKKEFKLEEGKFLGADEFMKGLMESDDYKAAFVVEKPEEEKPEDKKPPMFASATGTARGTVGGDKPAMNFGFTRLRQPEK